MKVKDKIKQLAQQSGLSEEQAADWLKVLDENEAFARNLDSGLADRSDYSRDYDSFRKEKQDFDGLRKAQTDWYTQANQEYTTAQRRLQAYQSQFGDLDAYQPTQNGGAVNRQTGDSMTKEEFEAALNERLQAVTGNLAQNFSKALKDVSRVSSRHLKEFGDVLDADALDTFMAEKGFTDVNVGYKEFVEPKVKEREAKEWETKLAEAEKRGAQNFASKHHLPVEPKPDSYVPLSERFNKHTPAAAQPEKAKNPSSADLFETFATGYNDQ